MKKFLIVINQQVPNWLVKFYSGDKFLENESRSLRRLTNFDDKL